LAYARFEIFTAVLLKISLLSLENSYWCFKVHTAFTFKASTPRRMLVPVKAQKSYSCPEATQEGSLKE